MPIQPTRPSYKVSLTLRQTSQQFGEASHSTAMLSWLLGFQGTCEGKDMMELEIRPYTESDDAVAAGLWRPCSDVTVMRETS